MVSWFIVVILCLYFHGPGIVASGRRGSSSSGSNDGVEHGDRSFLPFDVPATVSESHGVPSRGSQASSEELAPAMPRPIDAQRSEETTVSPSNDIVTLERELRDFRRAIRLTQEVQGIFQNIKNIPDHQTSVPWTYARALSYQLPSLPPLDKDDPRVILLYRQYIKYYYDLLKFQCKFEKLLDKAKKYDGTAYRKFRKLLDAGEYGDELQDGESGEEVAQSFIQEMEDRISMLSVEHGADLH